MNPDLRTTGIEKNITVEGKLGEKSIKMSEDNKMMNMLQSKRKEMETDFDVSESLVIDLGNAVTKIGFSGEDLPRLIIPSVIGESRISDDRKNNFTFEIK